jgi:hypothetical protein
MNLVDENDDYEGGIEEFIYSIDEGYIENVENHADKYSWLSYIYVHSNYEGYYYFVLGGYGGGSGKGIGVISPQPEIEIFGEESLQYLTSNGIDNLGYPIKLFNLMFTYIKEEQKKWLVFESNFHIATIDDREYRKVNSGFALVGCCYPISKYISPILVGKTPESVICDQGGREYLEFEYNGETWYCNKDDWGWYEARPSFNYSNILLNSIAEVNSLNLEDNSENSIQYWKEMAKRFLDMYFSGASYFPKTLEDFN